MANIYKFQRQSSEAYHKYISSLTDGNGEITKRLWPYIKNQWKDNFGVASLKHNDDVYDDNRMKAELLNNYFTSVFTPHSSEPPPIISDTSFPDIATISVDISGVLNLLNELDISKVTGPDNIPAYFLKLCAIKVAPILTLIFQASTVSINPVFHLTANKQTLSQYSKKETVPSAATTDLHH